MSQLGVSALFAIFRNAFSAIAIASVAPVLFACSTPYSPPIVTAPANQTVSAFPGIKQFAERGDLRIVWIHGMCSHNRDWADGRQALLESALEASAPRFVEGQADPRDMEAEPYVVRDNTGFQGADIETRYLIWSPATKDAKERLKQDSDSEFTMATLNRDLKTGLMNDCLSDAVAYLGNPGDTIKQWLKAQVCDAMNGSLGRDNRCGSVKPLDRSVVFVSESLGSKMLSDALQAVWESANRNTEDVLAANVARVQMYYVISNQIPMFNVAEYTPDEARAAGDRTGTGDLPGVDVFVEARERARKTRAFPDTTLHYVEFTDPNDVLSYRLLSRDVDEGIGLTNVVVSNGPTYFGFLENPLTAHCGYRWNPYVLGILMNGYDGSAVETLDLPSARQSCL
ncbi:MAG: hypothetical protein AAF724_03670 [Pseudomonadota bacterium]